MVKRIPELLLKERINPRREFFRASLEKVKDLFNLMDGDVWEVEEVKKQRTEKIENANGSTQVVGDLITGRWSDGKRKVPQVSSQKSIVINFILI